ncbi:MAG: hypothetical protein AAGH74_14885 [Pseudomonadota bacterium]
MSDNERRSMDDVMASIRRIIRSEKNEEPKDETAPKDDTEGNESSDIFSLTQEIMEKGPDKPQEPETLELSPKMEAEPEAPAQDPLVLDEAPEEEPMILGETEEEPMVLGEAEPETPSDPEPEAEEPMVLSDPDPEPEEPMILGEAEEEPMVLGEPEPETEAEAEEPMVLGEPEPEEPMVLDEPASEPEAEEPMVLGEPEPELEAAAEPDEIEEPMVLSDPEPAPDSEPEPAPEEEPMVLDTPVEEAEVLEDPAPVEAEEDPAPAEPVEEAQILDAEDELGDGDSEPAMETIEELLDETPLIETVSPGANDTLIEEPEEIGTEIAALEAVPVYPMDAEPPAEPVNALALDEAALEAMIKRVINEELMGEIGQNISANVQRLIEAEVARRLGEKND